MKRLVVFGAALALMSGVALAQTDDQYSQQQTPDQPATAGDQTDGGGMQGDDAGQADDHGMADQGQGDGERGWRHDGSRGGGWGHKGHGDGWMQGGPDGMRGPAFWWRHGGPGMMQPMRPSRGAVFRFLRGNGHGAIIIRCAEDDSTKECAQAVLPLLQTLMHNRGMGQDGAGPDAAQPDQQPAPAQ